MAIGEEFANTASNKVNSGGLLFNRKITRIVTPGTLIDEQFVNPYENNYLLAISPQSQSNSAVVQEAPAELGTDVTRPLGVSGAVGLAWLDLSTGDFYTQVTAGTALSSAIARIGAREIVIDSASDETIAHGILGVPDQQRHLVTRHCVNDFDLSISQWTPMLESAVPPETEATFTQQEVAAGNILLDYVREKLQGSGIKLQPPIRRQDTETMSIDKNSLRCLEILETAKDGIPGGKGSLLHSVRRTVTKGGTRMLKDWIGKSVFFNTSMSLISPNNSAKSHFI